MQQSENRSKKAKANQVSPPLTITILCGLLFAYGIFEIIYTFSGAYGHLHVAYSAINAFIVVLSFVALSGVWAFEKWGPIAFALVIALKAGSDLLFGNFQLWQLVSVLPAIIFLAVYKQMK